MTNSIFTDSSKTARRQAGRMMKEEQLYVYTNARRPQKSTNQKESEP